MFRHRHCHIMPVPLQSEVQQILSSILQSDTGFRRNYFSRKHRRNQSLRRTESRNPHLFPRNSCRLPEALRAVFSGFLLLRLCRYPASCSCSAPSDRLHSHRRQPDFHLCRARYADGWHQPQHTSCRIRCSLWKQQTLSAHTAALLYLLREHLLLLRSLQSPAPDPLSIRSLPG